VAYVDLRLGDFLDLVSERTPAPGAGAAAAITVSLAAGLVAMAGSEDPGEVVALGRRASALADEDAAAYGAVIEARRAGGSVADALAGATAVPLEIARIAAAIGQHAEETFRTGRPSARGDAATALLLAEGAVRSAAYLVEVNVAAGGGTREQVATARGLVAEIVARRERLEGSPPPPGP
jgi:formiminotetrahydrofolate cyclodeaminase